MTTALTLGTALITLTFTPVSAQTRADCLTDEVIKLLGEGYMGLQPLDVAIVQARAAVNKLPADCIPGLIDVVSSSDAPASKRCSAIVALGVSGIMHEANAAVPVLTNLITAADGKPLSPDDLALAYLAHVALARIGTPEARAFLKSRAGEGYWLNRAGFWNGDLGHDRLRPDMFCRAITLKAIGYLGDEDAERFLKAELRDYDRHSGVKHYRGEAEEDDVRSRATFALKILERERQFREYLKKDRPVSLDTGSTKQPESKPLPATRNLPAQGSGSFQN